MYKFMWSAIMIVALVILAVVNIKEVAIWVVIVDVVLGIIAAYAAFKIGKLPITK